MNSQIDHKQELKTRIEAKKKQLEARVQEAMADAQGRSRDEVERAKQKLAELQTHLKDGWDTLTEEAARKLNSWLKES